MMASYYGYANSAGSNDSCVKTVSTESDDIDRLIRSIDSYIEEFDTHGDMTITGSELNAMIEKCGPIKSIDLLGALGIENDQKIYDYHSIMSQILSFLSHKKNQLSLQRPKSGGFEFLLKAASLETASLTSKEEMDDRSDEVESCSDDGYESDPNSNRFDQNDEGRMEKKISNFKNASSTRYDDDTTNLLTKWFLEHRCSPYPSNDVKNELALKSGLTYSQVSNWFTNKRKRHWTPVFKKNSRSPRDLFETKILGLDAAETSAFYKPRISYKQRKPHSKPISDKRESAIRRQPKRASKMAVAFSLSDDGDISEDCCGTIEQSPEPKDDQMPDNNDYSDMKMPGVRNGCRTGKKRLHFNSRTVRTFEDCEYYSDQGSKLAKTNLEWPLKLVQLDDTRKG
mmetsp:Transcript_16547/g.23381  ORF Transcript_16547/g.23381 Transcript_16547/m.23381 type:complete len:398 (-) Transcript_16547:18-1211(-)